MCAVLSGCWALLGPGQAICPQAICASDSSCIARLAARAVVSCVHGPLSAGICFGIALVVCHCASTRCTPPYCLVCPLCPGHHAGICFGIALILNTIAIMYHSLAAVPFGYIVVVILMWFFISFPLCLVGTVIGRNWNSIPDNPCRWGMSTNTHTHTHTHTHTCTQE